MRGRTGAQTFVFGIAVMLNSSLIAVGTVFATVPEISVEAMVARADRIVVAEAMDVRCRWAGGGAQIAIDVGFRGGTAIRGLQAPVTFVLSSPGEHRGSINQCASV